MNRRKEEELKKAEEQRAKDKEKGLNNSKNSTELENMDGRSPRSPTPKGILVCGMSKARKIHRGPIRQSSTESASISLMRELHVHKIRLLFYNRYQYYPEGQADSNVF